MDMNALIHPQYQSSDRSATSATVPTSHLRPVPTALPGLHTHLASHCMSYFSSATTTSSSNINQFPRSTPNPLPPLRFIIPSSHCQSVTSEHTHLIEDPHELSSTRPQMVPQPTHMPSEQLQSTSQSHLQSPMKKLKRTRASKCVNRSTKSKARPGLRKGKWTEEESRYAARLTEYFKAGLLPIARGTMLRLYLSQKLNCEPMRITKKFTGGECIGKQVFRPCIPTPETGAKMSQAQVELDALEAAFLQRLQETQEGSIASTEADSPRRLKRSKQLGDAEGTIYSNNGTTSEEDDECGSMSDSSNKSIDSTMELADTSEAATSTAHDSHLMDDDAGAVGLLMGFFYKANRQIEQHQSSLTVGVRRERSFSNCTNEVNNNSNSTNRPRVDSITLVSI